jgi:hypothetical protein
MAERLLAKPGAGAVPVLVGDMTTARAEGPFTLVYLANTIMNVTTQDEQLAVFSNAAAHLRAGGPFVVSAIVPALGDVPPRGKGRVIVVDPDHGGIETFDDTAAQMGRLGPVPVHRRECSPRHRVPADLRHRTGQLSMLSNMPGS